MPDIEIVSREDARVIFFAVDPPQANMSSQKIERTEYGQEYHLVKGKREPVLYEMRGMGDLRMPDYVLEFKNA